MTKNKQGSKNKKRKERAPTPQKPENRPGESEALKAIGGSYSEDWNREILRQVSGTLWFGNSDEEDLHRQRNAVIAVLAMSKPNNELESMMLAQTVSAHHAAMECYRRSMIPEQNALAFRETLNLASKLSRTSAELLLALGKYRSRGQQKVTVEHVHVHPGGQAIVGNVESQQNEKQVSENPHHAKQITDASGTAMWSIDQEREKVPVAGDAERPLPDARRPVARRAKGK
jgi:hypothetical protein